MNEALAYIEENLGAEIDFKQVERLALCSEYHFRRMFSFLAGVTITEYIRRRRLTLAAAELIHGDLLIIDIALKYGYSSPDAFTKAFQKVQGVTPSEARSSGQPLKAYPRMTFQLTIRGGNEMNYRIVEKEAFYVVGITRRVPLVYRGANPAIDAMWASLDGEMITMLKGLSNIEPTGLISASTNFSEGLKAGLRHGLTRPQRFGRSCVVG